MQNFRNLAVWKKSHELALEIYKITEQFPRAEMFGLTSQLRRAASSVATNLAEGCGRTQAEFARFVQISFGSANEVEYQLLLAHDLSFLDAEAYDRAQHRIIEIKRMLTSLMRTIQKDAMKSPSAATH